MPRKKHLSGAQRAQQRVRVKRTRGQLEGTLVARTYGAPLNTLADLEQFLATVLSEVARGERLPEDGTKLAYIVKVAGELAENRLQREEIAALRAQLAALTGVSPSLLPSDDDDLDPIPLIAAT